MVNRLMITVIMGLLFTVYIIHVKLENSLIALTYVENRLDRALAIDKHLNDALLDLSLQPIVTNRDVIELLELSLDLKIKPDVELDAMYVSMINDICDYERVHLHVHVRNTCLTEKGSENGMFPMSGLSHLLSTDYDEVLND